MYRTIKDVLDTKGKALCIEPSKISQNPKKTGLLMYMLTVTLLVTKISEEVLLDMLFM